MPKLELVVLSLSIFLFVSIANAADETLRLSNAIWQVEIIPQSLAVNASPADGSPNVPISSGQAGLGPVTELSQQADTVTWKFPERSLQVRFALENESLSVEFTHDTSDREIRRLTWPVIEDFSESRAYILPFSEGSYVPKADRKWREFLSDLGPINTTAGLSMPFWGVELADRTLTYILTQPFNNEIRFSADFGMKVSHSFTPNWEHKRYGLRIAFGAASPVAPAKTYRQYLIENAEFVSFAEKVAANPEAEKLLGAAHAYLWNGKLLTEYDVTDWQAFATKLSNPAGDSPDQAVAGYVFSHLNAEAQAITEKIADSDYVDTYSKRVLSRALSEHLENADFYDPTLWADTPLAPETEMLVSRDVSQLSLSEIYRRNCLLLYAAFSEVLLHPDDWGDGLSTKLLDQFAESGLDRLWLGVDSWQDGFRHPSAVARARELGYLVGPYDSYHSIHHPDEKETWETAQFDLSLYEAGGIVKADGTKSRGFKKKGYHLSPIAAQPYVEKRVTGIMAQMPTDFNSWFIDCDAYGELFDNYSPSYLATQLDDMNARLARIAWIRDTQKMVVGSEGGAGYAAAAIHFAHGMMIPVIGWGDPDMKTKTSPYYVGGYWPPEGPAVHIKQVPLKPDYLYHYYDPRFRLPLYQIVFHDSVVTTNHWGAGTLKFKNAIGTLTLLQMLYNVPPLYHLTLSEFSKHKPWITRHYAFFSPLHREIGGQPMTDFQWLTPDRQVQRTEFGDTLEIMANFRTVPFEYDDILIPERSIAARWTQTGEVRIFSTE